MASQYEINILLNAKDKSAAAIKAMQDRIAKLQTSKDAFLNKQNREEYVATEKHIRSLLRLRRRFTAENTIREEVNPATRRNMRQREKLFQESKASFEKLNDLNSKQENTTKSEFIRQKAAELRIRADAIKAKEKIDARAAAQQARLAARQATTTQRAQTKTAPGIGTRLLNSVRGLFGAAPVSGISGLGGVRASTMFTAANGARARLMASGYIALALAVGYATLKFNQMWHQAETAFKTIMDGSDSASNHMKALATVSAKTGANFGAITAGSINLQRMGFSAKESTEQLQMFADAAAGVGKTGASADSAIGTLSEAFAEMNNKTMVTTGDITKLDSAIPGLSRSVAKSMGMSYNVFALNSSIPLSSAKAMAAINKSLLEAGPPGTAAGANRSILGQIGRFGNRALEGLSGADSFLGNGMSGINDFFDRVMGRNVSEDDSDSNTRKDVMMPGGKSFKGHALKQSSPSTIQIAWATMFDFVSRHATGLQQTLNKSWDYIKKHTASYWDQIVTYLHDTWDGLYTSVANTWQDIQDFIEGIWTSISDWFNANIMPIIQPIIDDFNWLKTTLSTIWDSVVNYVETAWYNIYNYVAPLVNNLVTAISGPIGSVGEWLSGAWNDIYTFATNTWYNIYSYIAPTVQNIVNFISGTLDSGRNTINNIWQMISDWATSTWDNIYNYVSPTVSNLVGVVTDFINGLGYTLSGIWTDISNFAYGAWADLHDSVYEAALGVYDDVTGIINNLWTTLQGLWNSMVSDARGAWNTITGLFNQVTGQTQQAPPLPDIQNNSLNSNSVSIPTASNAPQQVNHFDFTNAQVFGVDDLESMVTQAFNSAQRRGRLA